MAARATDVVWAVLQYIALGVKIGRGNGKEGDQAKFDRIAEYISEVDAWDELEKYTEMTEAQFVGYYKEKLEERRANR